MDDLDKPESEGEKAKAEDNPWYLLATLYRVPALRDQEIKDKNRAAWNRYFAANLDEETRARLIQEKRHSEEELTPFLPEELQEVEQAFAKRKGSANVVLPKNTDGIVFSNVQFDRDVDFAKYVFPISSFSNAIFSDSASFIGTTFSDSALFNGATFSDSADFKGATFSDIAIFKGASFSGSAVFEGATFSHGADCKGAAFSDRAVFKGATFSNIAIFEGATFSGSAVFKGATFSYIAIFEGATFSDSALFEGATFSDIAVFESATFSHIAAFECAIFSEMAVFDGVTFSGKTIFIETTFRRLSSFVNAEMKHQTSFEGAKFQTAPPEFFGAKLHQGTGWRGITWPPAPKDKREAGTFIDAYACLKLEMDRLKKHEDELDFFASNCNRAG